MKLSQIKSVLKALVPNHFHVTEVGKTTKHFIDSGGTQSKEDSSGF
ncbi:hypothetical protein F7651_10355 [Tenacibaculum piscium]|nr:hypothetical protein [Tenacibaculum piscium]MBE7670783.1 hypothetical protein [Tenacibaculum piscium]